MQNGDNTTAIQIRGEWQSCRWIKRRMTPYHCKCVFLYCSNAESLTHHLRCVSLIPIGRFAAMDMKSCVPPRYHWQRHTLMRINTHRCSARIAQCCSRCIRLAMIQIKKGWKQMVITVRVNIARIVGIMCCLFVCLI